MIWKPCFWSIAALSVLLGASCSVPWGGSETQTYIGEFPSKDAGIRAAIKVLAVEAKKHPNKKIIKVEWTGPYSDEGERERHVIGPRALLYTGDGLARALAWAHDPDSGASFPCYYVDPDAIEAVAEKGGTLEDFEQYARRSDVQFEIGTFNSADAGVRAAIKELAKLTRHPCGARSYRFVWTGPLSDDSAPARQSVGKQALFIYCGAGAVRALGYEPEASKGIPGRTYFVDDPALWAVAQRDGTLEDFADFDKRNAQAHSPEASSCVDN
jgi:hypothetical protein